MTPLEKILAALGDRVVKNSKDGIMARCPSHNDAHASLSVGEDRNG